MKLEGIEVVVFDIGNVLLSFKPLEFLNNRYTDEEIVSILFKEIFRSKEWLMLDRGTLTEKEAIDIISKRIPEYKEYVEDVFKNYYEMLLPIDSSIELAYKLKEEGYKLYLLSNYPKTAFQFITEKYKFFKIFDGGIISYKYKLLKPEKEIYDTLIDKYGLDPKKTLFIDDTKENTDMAEVIGFKTLWTKGEPISWEDLIS